MYLTPISFGKKSTLSSSQSRRSLDGEKPAVPLIYNGLNTPQGALVEAIKDKNPQAMTQALQAIAKDVFGADYDSTKYSNRFTAGLEGENAFLKTPFDGYHHKYVYFLGTTQNRLIIRLLPLIPKIGKKAACVKMTLLSEPGTNYLKKWDEKKYSNAWISLC